MTKYPKFKIPKIVISRCIEHDPVRYNGSMVKSAEVEVLKKFVEFIPVCPEIEIGLGVPREPVRIVRINKNDRLIQPATGRDLTVEINRFSENFLSSLTSVDGFILKNKSPTSGMANAYVYPGPDKANSIDKRAGFFGGAVLSKFKNYPVEDEGRIKNHRIRENFLTRIFMLSELRDVEKSGKYSRLSAFHHKNKTLIQAYDQNYLKILGNIAANKEELTFSESVKNYRKNLLTATNDPVSYKSNINAMMHAFGQISGILNKEEKEFFLENIRAYKDNLLPAIALKNILKTWIVRDDNNSLTGQTFFEPYPKEITFYMAEEMERGKEYAVIR
ncbi:DUF1722 domain-containing protein [Methanoplanus sp. FWC-SCC4]|uniref:DUF1722 domain-containing protein n=1 Tax=Methanochimaera problematica TaxID=2609417 RepID=A0AA97I5E3_9EURY|nr:DUF1722 domain-containing protein [Methanoplanus sp. FWC-SCC4]